MKRTILALILINSCFLQPHAQLITSKRSEGSFPVSEAYICIDSNDYPLVKKAAQLLQEDIERVTGKKPLVVFSPTEKKRKYIFLGSREKSRFASNWLHSKTISVADQWEAYTLKTIDQGLAIIGNDRRGTAYGVFELSRQLGVSPWYWWADVPVEKKEVFIRANTTLTDAPKVKYRGIFINDEAPALSNWSREKFGGFNHKFYEKVFELILRLKGNFLWPAMWGNAFYDDDSLNIHTADNYGIVIGTSHHEPMMRAHDEWRRYGKKQKWNYDSTENGLKEFWQIGMQRAWNEKIVSIGMRGDGDEPMSRETATALLEKIITDQRKIIEQVTGKPAHETPQLWALYKEVQDYYDKGMRVPDDVTLLLCDDNWGNIRKLPRPEEKPRKGGYGIYYHFDYVGGPRNYKWLNTNPLPRIWEQMHMAYRHGVKNIWIVNVGDIKPMELPISFFLDYAWNPERITQNNIQKYTEQWAARQFNNFNSKEIAELLARYAKYNSRRKPELLDANTFHLNHHNEWENVVKDYSDLVQRALRLNTLLQKKYRDAFYQLVLHPIMACANLYEMYYHVAMNKQAFQNRWKETNFYADKVKQLYIKDSLITLQYHQMNNGKWNHMMSQKHIGYTIWQEPKFQTMPEVYYLSEDSVNEKKETYVKDQVRSIIPSVCKRNIFYEQENHGVSIEAVHFTKANNSGGITWQVLPDHGRTLGAVTTFPVTAAEQKPGNQSPHLLYEVYTYSKDSLKIHAYFSPSLNYFNTSEGLQYAISIDNETPQILSINKEDKNTGTGIWSKWVAENIIIKTSSHYISKPGKHLVKYWMVNSGVVLQKLVLDFGNVKHSYLGPPETRVKTNSRYR